MRTFAPYDKTKQAPRATEKARRVRTATEWDIRIDCDQTYVEEIIANLKKSRDLIHYALVSGLEQPDEVKYGSKDVHCHIALIVEYHMRRDQVLALCRGHLKKTDEYCTPRNRKFTYAGWFLHHTKLDWKLVLEPPQRLEIGTLPDDEVTDENKKEVLRMIKKFGSDEEAHETIMRIKFAKYLQ
uniref:Replication-associated protein n=1 Tax=Grus japonensis CRESS-DNA-virus sp. TaxID=2815045 RepID=A0A8A4XB77_9VIRU|nr:MAG: replication-associated protein [Grus japonensis CRESS-DNA-virus sp.]